MSTSKQNNFKKEYREFIEDYLLGLLGIDNHSSKNKLHDYDPNLNIDHNQNCFISMNEKIFFGTPSELFFYMSLNNKLDQDDISLMECIIAKFINLSKYKYSGQIKNTYVSNIHKEINYNYAIQSGICEWLSGNRKNTEITEKLLKILDTWASKTYEGKKVSYGLVFDSSLEEKNNDVNAHDFANFLNDEYSAVLTDSITSVFILNKNFGLSGYETIFDNMSKNTDNLLINNLPIRFADIITKTVNTPDRIGIFLLSNGDIILSKNKEIRFVKRINKWLNFNIKSFKFALSGYLSDFEYNDELINEIYSSALDVSFSHAGGIIAVIDSINNIIDSTDNTSTKILNKCDYISDESNESIKKYLKDKNNILPNTSKISPEILEKEIEKKLLKRNIIKKLVNNTSFINLNRKLRCELISLDGACIVNKEGKICSFGAIIQNDSGSTGGGRGAAAKKLSQKGFAIKISTDGYIELYYKFEKIFVIK